jgi:hypothetical protein
VLSQAVDLYRQHTDLLELEFVSPDAPPPDLVKRYDLNSRSPRIVVAADNGVWAKLLTPTEEAMTNALIKVSEKDPKKVYFLSGHGEPNLEDALFERLTTQLVRHVSQGRLLAGSRRARVLVERDRYPVGATVVVRLVAADGDGGTVLAGAICRVEGPDGVTVNVPLSSDPGRPGVFQGGLVASREGGWRIDVDLGDGSGEVISRRVQARLPDRELERPRLDRGLLERLGAITGGSAHFLVDTPWGASESAALAARIPDKSRREYETGAPDGAFKRRLNALLLALGAGLLCLEWIIRRLVKLA